MSNPVATPRSKGATDPTTPVGNRLAVSAVNVLQSSPHYTTTRRHSLYGTEDRIILDPGSRVWKVGFSGEGRPRDVFFAESGERTALWGLARDHGGAEQEEEGRMLKIKLQDRLRKIFHEILLTDPKSRKVIIVEHPLLPLYIKDMMASVLFDNLQVPFISFASSHMLALLAVGRMTGLVLDCGYLETTVLPIFASRPLYPQLKTTPLAGGRFTSHLRALLLMFATYIPPLTTLGGAANIPVASRSLRVPEEVLTDAVMEDIKARCCFVGEMLDSDAHAPVSSFADDSGSTEPEIPPSDSSQLELESGINTPASPPSSRLSSVTSPSGVTALTHALSRAGTGSSFGVAAAVNFDRASGERHLQAISTMYSRYSTATDLLVRVDPPPAQNTGTGQGTLRIPGWVRERAAEVLFEGGDVDEGSVAEVLLDALLRVPVDLRRTLAGSILVVGGTAMLPGFIPRLQNELVRLLTRRPPERSPTRAGRPAPPPYDPYAPLRPLAPYIAVLNNPSPPRPNSDDTTTTTTNAAGKAPAFTPAMLPWIGGSLAGALKIGGAEISREKWDEAEAMDEELDDDDGLELAQGLSSSIPAKRPGFHLPDWTRAPLSPGAPTALRPPPRIEITDMQMEDGS
ncbi:actin-like ATPase domain-containing protein [Fomitiporia mediterranea MF3/22]|uniref:actin-like ATPase domain-containing protein n=1 Tax=Fomitiporia mediterranea (strain MF3/22) TaxID=694068 RepID=UPI00044076D4|nr:actin-like ATPase domain-containing protein [Fomitiporia mediterranea MF3/22]EJD06873.1 actin-like ATPase domain-containing protein [Fomitiporia mediterranea MF3/22]